MRIGITWLIRKKLRKKAMKKQGRQQFKMRACSVFLINLLLLAICCLMTRHRCDAHQTTTEYSLP